MASIVILGSKQAWSWAPFQQRCARLLGYTPPVSKPLTPNELSALGFTEAAKSMGRSFNRYFASPGMLSPEHGA